MHPRRARRKRGRLSAVADARRIDDPSARMAPPARRPRPRPEGTRRHAGRLLVVLAAACAAPAMALSASADPPHARAPGSSRVHAAAARGLDASPGDAHAGDAGDAGPPRALAEAQQRLALLERRRDAVGELLAGSLPEDLYTTEIFAVDVLDQGAVDRKKEELSAALAAHEAKRSDAGEALDAGRADAASAVARPGAGDAGVAAGALPRGPLAAEIDAMERDLDRAELTFLSKPLDERRTIVLAETERRRLSAEREAASAAKERADVQERLAEAARSKALADVDEAREASGRALAGERARAEGIHAEQAGLRGALADRRQALTTAQRDAGRRVFALTEAAQDAPAGGKGADQTYDRIVVELEGARADLRAALDARAALRPVPRYAASPGVLGVLPARARGGPRRVSALSTQLTDDGAALDAEQRALAWEAIEGAKERVEALNAARLSLLDKLGADKRGRVLGVGEEGRGSSCARSGTSS